MSLEPRADRGSMTAVVLLCVAIGAVTVGATLTLARGPLGLTRPSAAKAPAYATEEYGRRLIETTTEYLGPDVADPKMRYTSSRLACASCHFAIGTEPGTLTLLQANEHYPRFSARVGTKTDLADRVNECMQRSLNGRPLPRDSAEMIAMVSYLKSLGDLNAALGASARKAKEPEAFKTPKRAASLEAGRHVFEQRCAACHGTDGLGLHASADPLHGYVFPPLWGPDSFNDGAGMHRALTAAKFVKARMPLGKPDLSDDQAFDVAAYLNSQPRPEMPNLAQDYPDRTAKPADNGYGPFADSFPLEQHRFGPFGPIESYYKKLKDKK
jgi:thiosulfate dehydrogenase